MKVSEFVQAHTVAAKKSAQAKFVNITGTDYQRLVAMANGETADLEDDRGVAAKSPENRGKS